MALLHLRSLLRIYADIVWCQATLQDDLREIIPMVARSKGREFVAHAKELRLGTLANGKLGEYADQLRVDSRLAERKRWQASRKAKADIALDEVMRSSNKKIREIEIARILLFPRPLVDDNLDILTNLEGFLQAHPKAVILDVTLSRWGSEKDHFFHSGHGTRAHGQSGLIVVNEEGTETLLSEDEILSMPALRRHPLIVLSACETARGEQGSSEMFDVASCFLRVGARYLIGSLWVVRSDCATVFSASFYKQIQNGSFPNQAYGEAIRDLRSLLHLVAAHLMSRLTTLPTGLRFSH